MENNLTSSLMLAHHYVKDNRLLPAGFDKTTGDEYVQVAVDAMSDENFSAGGDIVSYVVNARDFSGPFTVEAQMLYQPAGYRWLHKFSEMTLLRRSRSYRSSITRSPLPQ